MEIFVFWLSATFLGGMCGRKLYVVLTSVFSKIDVYRKKNQFALHVFAIKWKAHLINI